MHWHDCNDVMLCLQIVAAKLCCSRESRVCWSHPLVYLQMHSDDYEDQTQGWNFDLRVLQKEGTTSDSWGLHWIHFSSQIVGCQAHRLMTWIKCVRMLHTEDRNRFEAPQGFSFLPGPRRRRSEAAMSSPLFDFWRICKRVNEVCFVSSNSWPVSLPISDSSKQWLWMFGLLVLPIRPLSWWSWLERRRRNRIRSWRIRQMSLDTRLIMWNYLPEAETFCVFHNLAIKDASRKWANDLIAKQRSKLEYLRGCSRRLRPTLLQ